MSTSFVTRFAPSPTGYLHLGHAYAALIAYRAAEREDGRFLLRIEDIDQGRCKPTYEAAILEDLAWLGLVWETPVRRQSEHFDAYAAALDQLIDIGVVYRCFKTRKQVLDDIARAPHLSADGPDGPIYVGAALPAAEEKNRLAAGEPFAWRLSLRAASDHLGDAIKSLSVVEETMADDVIELDASASPQRSRRALAATPGIFGDPIIARKDAGTSYHLASVVDDALQDVTHVIRGQDLRAADHLHALLQALLSLPAPIYRHHHLITDENGERFAKRNKSATIRAFREAGGTPEALISRFARPTDRQDRSDNGQ